MDHLNVYPFLISRNFDADYRLVYAPSICSSPEIPARIFDATSDASEDADHDLHFTTLDLPSSSVPCGVAYRVIHATGFDIGEDSSRKLADNVGRTIYHVEGILMYRTDSHLVRLIDKERFFQLVHIPMMNHYRRFWRHSTIVDDIPTESSIPLSSLILENRLKELESINSDQAEHYDKGKASDLGQRNRLNTRVLGFAIAVGIMAVVISLHYIRKVNAVVDTTKSILGAQAINRPLDERLANQLVSLSRTFSKGDSRSGHLNCVTVQLIMTHIHDHHSQKILLQEEPTHLTKEPSRSDLGRLQRSLSFCQEKMKILPFAINERIRFLQH